MNSQSSLSRWVQLLCCGLTTATCHAAALVTPDITITGLTHTFGHIAGAMPSEIMDSAEAGQYTQTGFTATLTGSELVVSRFEAAPGKKFVMHTPPAGYNNINLWVNGEWQAGTDGGSYPISSTITFEHLVGSAPVLDMSGCVIGVGGKWVRSWAIFIVAPGTEFTGVQLSAQYAFNIANPASQALAPGGFTFMAIVGSSEILGDGSVMTLEDLPRPALNITRSGLGVTVRWPTNYDNWVLETSTQLGSISNWAAATNTCVIAGTNFMVTDLDIGPARYYRLQTP